jgi:hypothetical protein
MSETLTNMKMFVGVCLLFSIPFFVALVYFWLVGMFQGTLN